MSFKIQEKNTQKNALRYDFEKLRLLSGYIIGESNESMPKVLEIWVSSFLRTRIKYLAEQFKRGKVI